MNTNQYQITSKQLRIIIISSQIGLGILTFPSDIAKDVGHDGWISVLLGGIVFSLLSMLMVLLLRRYGSRSIVDINKLQFGKFFGTVINIIFLMYFCTSTFNGVRLFVEYVKLTVLTNTPPIILTCLLVATIIYVSYYGLKPVARFCSITYIGIIATIVVIILVYQDLNGTFLLPVGKAGVFPLLKETYKTTYALLGPEIVALLYPYVSDKENVLKKTVEANVITVIFYAVVVVATTALYGEKMLEKTVIPIINLSRTYYAPIFERIDLFYFALWVPNITSSVGAYFFTAQIGIKQFFGLKVDNNLALAIFSIAIIALSRLPKGLNEEELYMTVISISGLSIFGIMVVSYFLSFLIKRGVDSK